jgi:hypothetical protein
MQWARLCSCWGALLFPPRVLYWCVCDVSQSVEATPFPLLVVSCGVPLSVDAIPFIGLAFLLVCSVTLALCTVRIIRNRTHTAK